MVPLAAPFVHASVRATLFSVTVPWTCTTGVPADHIMSTLPPFCVSRFWLVQLPLPPISGYCGVEQAEKFPPCGNCTCHAVEFCPKKLPPPPPPPPPLESSGSMEPSL